MKLLKKIYFLYEDYIFPRISHIRGSTRLKMKVKQLALRNVPEVDEKPELFEELEWDNLIVLDACRHDLYSEVRGSTNYRISGSSISSGAVRENFSEGDWSDTILVTANINFHPPKFKDVTGRELEEVFHSIFPLYDTEWSDKYGTVHPKSVKKAALTAEKLFPERRKIIWFMQPHIPFIDSDLRKEAVEEVSRLPNNKNILNLAERGALNREVLWGAYKENLKLVLDKVEDLDGQLSGKTVVTSDHGNLFGEAGFYGHPPNLDKKVLRKVPLEKL